MAQHDVHAQIQDNSNKTTTTHTRKKPSRKKRSHDFSDVNYNPVRGETAVWVAVITQAMMDALSRSNNSEMRYHREEAVRWLTGNSKDFVTVCLLAGFDPDYIRIQAKRSIASPRLWRAEAGKGARYEERKAYRERIKKQKRQKQQALVTA